MIHRQEPQDSPDASQVTLHTSNKFNLPISQKMVNMLSLYKQTLYKSSFK